MNNAETIRQLEEILAGDGDGGLEAIFINPD